MFKILVTAIGIVMALMLWDIDAAIYRAQDCRQHYNRVMHAEMEAEGTIQDLTLSSFALICTPGTFVTTIYQDLI
jgi:hypothetical protein